VVLGRLDIADRLLPQDGRVRIQVDGKVAIARTELARLRKLLANRIGADCVIDIAPDNYIRKPVDPSRLLARVRAAVRRAS
jgi:type II secretory ATPase GspE/PulE/Tfp pilus assembly ATPase PilB-like protein